MAFTSGLFGVYAGTAVGSASVDSEKSGPESHRCERVPFQSRCGFQVRTFRSLRWHYPRSQPRDQRSWQALSCLSLRYRRGLQCAAVFWTCRRSRPGQRPFSMGQSSSAPSRWGSPAAPLLPPPMPGGGFLGEARASCCRGCGRGGSPSGAKGWCLQVGLVQKPCRFCVARVRNTRFHFCIIIHYYGWATVRERNGLSSAGSTSPSLPVGTAVAGQCIKADPNSKRVCYMQHVTACTGQSAADYDK